MALPTSSTDGTQGWLVHYREPDVGKTITDEHARDGGMKHLRPVASEACVESISHCKPHLGKTQSIQHVYMYTSSTMVPMILFSRPKISVQQQTLSILQCLKTEASFNIEFDCH